MKKTVLRCFMILSSGFAYSSVLAASAILLQGGELKPSAVLSISLDPLLRNVQYNLSCQISNPNAALVELGFAFDLKGGGVSADFSLNNTVLENGQASLKQTENTLEVMVSSAMPGNTVLVKNLDLKQAVQVNNCVASPSLKTLEPRGRFFVASNNSDGEVELSFGGSRPLLYKLAPHSKRYIFVSSANQELSIQSNKG